MLSDLMMMVSDIDWRSETTKKLKETSLTIHILRYIVVQELSSQVDMCQNVICGSLFRAVPGTNIMAGWLNMLCEEYGYEAQQAKVLQHFSSHYYT